MKFLLTACDHKHVTFDLNTRCVRSWRACMGVRRTIALNGDVEQAMSEGKAVRLKPDHPDRLGAACYLALLLFTWYLLYISA